MKFAKTRITPSLCQGCHERALCLRLKILTFVSVFALPLSVSCDSRIVLDNSGTSLSVSALLLAFCAPVLYKPSCGDTHTHTWTQVTKAFKIKFPRYLMRDDGGAKHFGQM